MTGVESPCASMDAHILTNWLDSEHALKPPSVPVSLPESWVSIDQSINQSSNVSVELNDASIKELLECFDVSLTRGFIGDTDPLLSLPKSSRFYVWEELIDRLTGRLIAHDFRSAVETLPVLSIDQSTDQLTPAELRRAQLVLSMLAHAYVWGDQSLNRPTNQSLPACLSVPWVQISHLLGRVPVLTHSSIILANWRFINPPADPSSNEAINLSNVETINQFYGGIDEAIFYLVTLEVEARGAPAIKHMLRAQHAAKQIQAASLSKSTNQPINQSANWATLASEMNAVANVLTNMTTALMLMYRDCDPYIFYTRVRLFLQGWRGNPALPEGLLYEGVSEHRQLFHGGSAAQSCIVSLFDAFLGVSHERVQTKQFMQDMRYYMPGTHRQFLQFIEQQCSIRSMLLQYINQSINQSTPATHGEKVDSTMLVGHVEDPEIALAVAAFNNVVSKMVTFRTKHIGVVATYILAQAHNVKNKIAPSPLNNALDQTINQSVKQADVTGNEGEGVATSERGTGGTSIMPYLKTARDNTKDRMLNVTTGTN